MIGIVGCPPWPSAMPEAWCPRVFVDDGGEPILPESVRLVLEQLDSHAGVRLHDLRHTHTPIALRTGDPSSSLSERIGHTTPAFGLQQYAHTMPGMQAEAAPQVVHLIDSPSVESADLSGDEAS